MDNWQAVAYTKVAMRRQGFSEDQIRKVIREMEWVFSEVPETEIESEAEILRERDQREI